MDVFVRDLRLAVRTVRRQPGFFTAALLTLALGIGATTAVFSVAHATLLRPLPFRDPGRLMMVYLTPPEGIASRLGPADIPWSYPKLRAFRRLNDTFEEIAVYAADRFTLTGGGYAERLEAEYVSGNYFRVLGAAPLLGRAFTDAEDATPGTHAVAILGESVWRRRFNADPAVVGRSLRLSDQTYTVVGVMPQTFTGLTGRSEVWVPTMMYPAEMLAEPMSHWLDAVARVRPGLSIETARARVPELGEAIDREVPDTTPFAAGRPWGARAVPLDQVRVPAVVRRSIAILLAAVCFVLLIGCANLANLQLARGSARGREIAVRFALGATRGRVVRDLLAESVVLSLAGAVAGLALAAGALRLIETTTLAMGADGRNRLAGFTAQLFEGAQLDLPVLMFAGTTAIATALLFGLLPAWEASRTDLVQPLKSGGGVLEGGRALGARPLLVAAQLALALVLLTAAGITVRSFAALQRIDTGFNAEDVSTLRVDLPPWRYEAPARAAAAARLIDTIRAVPGVDAAGVNNCTPLSGACNSTVIWFRDRRAAPESGRPPEVGIHFADAGYFRALQIPLIRGRLFRSSDDARAPRVAIVNEAAARAFWPDEDPIGKQIRVGQGNYTPEGTWAEVVGVVKDVRYGPPQDAAGPDVYAPATQVGRMSLFVFARAERSTATVTGAVAAAIRGVDPELPIYSIRTMRERAGAATARPRLIATLLGFFAVAAIALAAVGTYAVVAYAVLRRTREIGVRIALGATRGQVLRGVLAQGLLVGAGGIIAGVAGSYAAARVLRAVLVEAGGGETAILAAASGALLVVALAACLPAALRASRVDPMTALRYD